MDESGDEAQYPDVPAESAAAPFFEMKLKHYKIFEGMPVTFTCRVAGNPTPKVSGRCHFLSIAVTKHLSSAWGRTPLSGTLASSEIIRSLKMHD